MDGGVDFANRRARSRISLECFFLLLSTHIVAHCIHAHAHTHKARMHTHAGTRRARGTQHSAHLSFFAYLDPSTRLQGLPTACHPKTPTPSATNLLVRIDSVSAGRRRKTFGGGGGLWASG